MKILLVFLKVLRILGLSIASLAFLVLVIFFISWTASQFNNFNHGITSALFWKTVFWFIAPGIITLVLHWIINKKEVLQ